MLWFGIEQVKESHISPRLKLVECPAIYSSKTHQKSKEKTVLSVFWIKTTLNSVPSSVLNLTERSFQPPAPSGNSAPHAPRGAECAGFLHAAIWAWIVQQAQPLPKGLDGVVVPYQWPSSIFQLAVSRKCQRPGRSLWNQFGPVAKTFFRMHLIFGSVVFSFCIELR